MTILACRALRPPRPARRCAGRASMRQAPHPERQPACRRRRERSVCELPRQREIVAYRRGPYRAYASEAVQPLRQNGYRARNPADVLPRVGRWRQASSPHPHDDRGCAAEVAEQVGILANLYTKRSRAYHSLWCPVIRPVEERLIEHLPLQKPLGSSTSAPGQALRRSYSSTSAPERPKPNCSSSSATALFSSSRVRLVPWTDASE